MTDPIAFDTETCLITPGNLAPPLVCLSVAEGVDTALVHHTDALPYVEGLLESDRVLVGHNVAYDFGVIVAKWPHLLPAIFEVYGADRVTDTMLREKLQHIALGIYRGFLNAKGRDVKLFYSLGDIVKRKFDVELEKDGGWRLRYGELLDVPLEQWPQDAKDYATDDAKYTLAVCLDQESDGAHLLLDQFRQARAAWWLHLMSCWGLKTDLPGVREFARITQQAYDEVAVTLLDAGLLRTNGTRDTKVAKALMAEKYPDHPVTKTGAVSLSADACKESGDPILEAYAELSSLTKKLSTDVPLLEGGMYTPIQPRFDLLETGRTSTKPNVQNLPRKSGVRECFVPREGMVYADADYSRFELHSVAQVCITVFGHSKLAEALNAGIDPHLGVAAQLLGITYEEALTRKDEQEVDDARQAGKVANFGFPGGLGITRFCIFARSQYDVIVTEDEASRLKSLWLETWPEFQDYFTWVGKLCDEISPQIEQLFSGRFRGGVSYCEACNSFFQGLAADAAKAAGFLIAEACYVDQSSPLYGSRPCNFVHDEFIVETPEEGAAEAAEELARLMVVGASPWLPDVPPLAEPLLMRRWSKKAKTLRDGAGRLVPWNIEM